MTSRELAAVFAIVGAITLFVVNLALVDRLVVPDPCRWHGHENEAGILINLLYEFSADEGYHPIQYPFNHIVALLLGAGLGLLLYRVSLRLRLMQGGSVRP